MYLDKERMFSEAQAITASAASTNILDMMNVANRIGEALKLFAQVDTEFDSAAEDSTLAIALQSDAVEAFSSPKTMPVFT